MYTIYKITNTITKRVYIGLTMTHKACTIINTRAYGSQVWRFAEHIAGLRRRDHFNPFMQADFDEHGVQSFKFKIIEVLPEYVEYLDARDIEREYMRGTKAELYNIKSYRHYTQPCEMPVSHQEILRHIKTGRTGKAIAAELGVSQASVSLIKVRSGLSKSLKRKALQDRIASFRHAMQFPVLKDDGSMHLAKTIEKYQLPRHGFLQWRKTIQTKGDKQ